MLLIQILACGLLDARIALQTRAMLILVQTIHGIDVGIHPWKLATTWRLLEGKHGGVQCVVPMNHLGSRPPPLT